MNPNRNMNKNRNIRILLFICSIICFFFFGTALGNELCIKFMSTASFYSFNSASSTSGSDCSSQDLNVASSKTQTDTGTDTVPDSKPAADSSDSGDDNSSGDNTSPSGYKPGDLDKIIMASANNEKIVYLTFDDGPTYTTPEILDILDKYKIKATFFVVGSMCSRSPSILKREYNDGQFICNHTYSHDYKYIYSSPENFIADIQKCEKEIQSILGNQYKTWLVRFPGGSEYNDYLPKDNSTYTQALIKAGYSYVNWNALTGDAESKNISVQTLISNAKEGIGKKKKIVILMHDCTQENTVSALPEIIEYLKSNGYQFRTLNELKD